MKSLKWFIQRGKRGYADCDVWEMGDYLTAIILPMLKQLQKEKISYPCTHFNLSCNCEQEWEEALQGMIEGFEAAKRVWGGDYPTKFYFQESQKDERLFRHKMRSFVKYFFALWS